MSYVHTSDFIQVDSRLNGKSIVVIESRNATLKTNVYNNGFYVDADYIDYTEGNTHILETTFIVLKIG